MPDFEVIAGKCKFPVGRAIINAAAIVLVWAVLLGCLFGSGLVQNQSGGIAAACIVLLSFVTLSDCAIFIYSYTKWKALPEDLIIFSNGKLIMPGRTAELSQIVYVSDSGGKTAGGIVFSFKNGGICTIGFINDAQSASKRINELILLTAPSDSGVRERSSREVLGVKAKSGRYNILVACAAVVTIIFFISVLGVVAMFITAEDVARLAISTSSFSVLAVVCLCLCVLCVRYYRDYKILPRELLTKSGDNLYYAGFEFNIGTIERIEYKGYPQNNYFKDTGVLKFYLNDGTKLKCSHFFRPHVIYRDLQNIIAEYNNRNK